MNTSKNSVITLKSYFYLDEFEINGLYNQLYPDVLQETTTYKVNKNTDLAGSINGSVLGMIETEGGIEHSSDTSFSGEIQTKVAIEYKTNVIIQHVCDNLCKRGSSSLRKIGYEVMRCLKTHKGPEDAAVYRFILKKEKEGKSKRADKIAGLNKFPRIYYARVMEVYQN